MRLLFSSLGLFALSKAQYIIEGASFGHGQGISPNKYAIPGWHVSGDGHTPQLLSDKVILTPPYPGNKRGALWTDARVVQPEWVANFQFRATGPENGGGNLQLWYTREGQAEIGTSSVYTVNKFEGLVLVIDMYGGRGGGIRGFLNDGTVDFKNHHHLEALAFGHCDYSYRNRGRPTNIELKQDSNGFQVSVDNNLCFQSELVLLPSDNYFGITAASSDVPDSFEVFKFTLATTPSISREEPRRTQQARPQSNHESQQQQAFNPPKSQRQPPPGQGQQQQVVNPSSSTILDSQLSDMTARLDSITREAVLASTKLEIQLSSLSALVATSAQLKALEDRVMALDAQITNLRNDVVLSGQGTGEKFEAMHAKLGEGHELLLENLQERVGDLIERRGGRYGPWLLVLLMLQVGGVAGWVVWRRRREQGSKKYL